MFGTSRNSLMGLGSGASGTALPPHHGHHAHHPGSYLLNGHDKEFKGLNAFEKYKSSSSPYGKHDTHSDDEDERVDIMDDDDDAMTSSSTNGHVSNSQGSGEANDFHHKLFAFDASKQTSADAKGKPGKSNGHVLTDPFKCALMAETLVHVKCRADHPQQGVTILKAI